MNEQFLKNPDEQFQADQSWQYYSSISNPSFRAFQEISEDHENLLEKFMIDPYVREVMLANLKKEQVKLAMMYFNIIIGCGMVTKVDKKLDLTPTANLFSRKLLALILLSMGTEQSFLKTMLTNWSIQEQRIEEKAYQEIKHDQKEDEQKQWKFLPKRGLK